MSSQRQVQKKPGSNSYSPPAKKAATWQRPFSDPVYDAVSPKQDEAINPRAGFNLMQMKIFPDSPAPVQAKLSVGAPGDKYEQEADIMASQVMKMSAPENEEPVEGEQKEVQTKPLAEGISPMVQREIAPEESPLQKKTIQRDELTENKPEEEDLVAQKSPAPESIQRDEATAEEKPQEDLLAQKSPAPESIQRDEAIEDKPKEEDLTVQQKAASEGKSSDSGNLESQLNGSKGGGSPLADEVRAFMEPRFGADFSGVRVHTDSNAVQMNKDLGAQAFAHGSDIYYGAGKSPGKDELTAHELTHTVQQTGLVARRFTTPLEKKENKLQTKLDFSQSPVLASKILRKENTSVQDKDELTAHELTHVVQQTGRVQLQSAAQQELNQPIQATAPANAMHIRDFIKLVEAEEAQYPDSNRNTKLMITRLRKVFYDQPGWNAELIPGATKVKGHYQHKKELEESYSLDLGLWGPFEDINVVKNRYPATDSRGNTPEIAKHQEIKLADGSYIDIGHVFAGLDALNYPTSVGRLTIQIDSNVDATTWVGDLGSVLAEIKLKGLRQGRKILNTEEAQAIINEYASAQDMLGNIDAYVIGKEFDIATSKGKKVSEILREYYLGEKTEAAEARKHRYSNFAQSIGLTIEQKNPATFSNEAAWVEKYTDQVNDAAALYIGASTQGTISPARYGAIFGMSQNEGSRSLMKLFLTSLKQRISAEPGR